MEMPEEAGMESVKQMGLCKIVDIRFFFKNYSTWKRWRGISIGRWNEKSLFSILVSKSNKILIRTKDLDYDYTNTYKEAYIRLASQRKEGFNCMFIYKKNRQVSLCFIRLDNFRYFWYARKEYYQRGRNYCKTKREILRLL